MPLRPKLNQPPSRSAPPTRRKSVRRKLPRISVPSPRTMFLVAAIVSLLIHVAVALPLHNIPLGHIDPSLIDEAEQIRRLLPVERTPLDRLTDWAGPAQEPISEDVAIEDLSRELLQEQAPADPLDEQPPVDLDNVEDARPETLADASTGPDFSLGDEVFDQLIGPLDLTVTYQTGEIEVRPGAGRRVSAQTVTATARSLLASAGLSGNRPGPPPSLAKPDYQDTRPIDQRLVDPPVQGPEIDFSTLALSGATQLKIPERLDNDFDYRVFVHQPGLRNGRIDPDRPGYFRVDITARRSLRRLQTMPKDVIFLIDTSGSIPQNWVDQVIAGVSDALNTLGPGDRFNIVFFDEKPRFFSADRITTASNEAIAEAREFLRSGSSKGYTDLNRALSRLLVRDLEADRVYTLLFISDGVPTRGVMDTRELINLITRDNDLVAGIYCVGVGGKQNRELLDFLSYRNKGFSIYADKREEAAGLIRQLASQLRYPILRDVRVATAGSRIYDVYPINLPDIHQSQTFTLYGRFTQLENFTMRITGRNDSQEYAFTFSRDASDCLPADESIARGWAFVKLHHLYSELLRSGQNEGERIREQIKQLRDRYDLKTLY